MGLRRLALPRVVKHWSLTTLREKLIKIGAKVVRHARYTTFQMAWKLSDVVETGDQSVLISCECASRAGFSRDCGFRTAVPSIERMVPKRDPEAVVNWGTLLTHRDRSIAKLWSSGKSRLYWGLS